MGLDVKERRLIAFLVKQILPFVVAFSSAASYFKLWTRPATLLGYSTVAIWVYKALKLALNSLKRKVFPVDVKSYGRWAIVTGCTAGIGEAYAQVLAERGMDLVLISRSIDKLEEVAKGIKKDNPKVEIKLIAHDYQAREEVSKAFYKKLDETVRGLEGGVGLLVNNVGIVNQEPFLMHELDEDLTYGMLKVNVEGTVRMTRAIVPFMMERRKGAILNISSGSGNHPTPMISVYAATKAFITQLSQSLTYEYKEYGIDVLGLTPYYVISNQFKRNEPSYLAPTARKMVEDSLPLIGNEYRGYPYWVHALCGFAASIYWDVGGGLLMVMKRTKARMEEKRLKPRKANGTKVE